MPDHKLVLLGAAVLWTGAYSAKAACTDKDLDPDWHWNYAGTIGDKYHVRLTLTADHGKISGVYFYSTQLTDIKVAGRISGGTRVDLDEFDAGGRVTAQFEAEFPEHDPRGKLTGTLQCEVITGSWRKTGAAQALPVYLSQEDGAPGSLDHLYAIAGAQDDSLIHRNALRFWQAVAAGDKSTVASLIDYPIKVHIAGTSKTIRTSLELLSRYDAIFSPAYRKAISEAMPRNMLARNQGIMLGRGEVWFGADGRVVALNN